MWTVKSCDGVVVGGDGGVGGGRAVMAQYECFQSNQPPTIRYVLGNEFFACMSARA